VSLKIKKVIKNTLDINILCNSTIWILVKFV